MSTVPPIRRALVVPVTPHFAFDVFTRDIGRWWPLEELGVYGAGATVAFEGRELVERSPAGEASVWGTVTDWVPGGHVGFSWHPGRSAEDPTHVQVTFEEINGGTLVTLTHTGWEAYEEPWEMRRSYDDNWPWVLDRFGSETAADPQAHGDGRRLDPRYAPSLREVLAHSDGFGHAEHLELAWRYLELFELDKAERAMAAAIRHVAATHGQAGRYHETMTVAWVRLVAVHREGGGAGTFEEFIARNEQLLDRDLLKRHYSAERMASDEARATFAAPDLKGLP